MEINYSLVGKLLLILILYLSTRLINLSSLPIFNDEGIYLDWGQRMIHSPGHAFYSLYDGKQPLLMWIFGMANEIINDPLVAGRLVAVALGGLGMLGIYGVGGFWAAIVYIVVPLFVFFDRQALMESTIACVNIWSLFFLIKFRQKKESRWGLGLGILGGLGLFVKSNAIIFCFLPFVYLIYLLVRVKKAKEKQNIFWGLMIMFVSGLVILMPLLIQPNAINIIKMGDRFNLTSKELLSLPIAHWWQNLKALGEISLWQLTPPITLLGITGIVWSLKKRSKIILFWFFGALIISVLTTRNLNSRYLMPLLIPVSLFAAFGIRYFLKKQKILSYLILLLFFLPSYISIILITNPVVYFNILNRLTPAFSQKGEYVTDNPSGYGLAETRRYLETKAMANPLYVGVRLDAGNPENSLMAYYFKNPKISVIYFDKQLFAPDFPIDKLKLDRPLYFVSRSEHRGGMENYLIEERRFYKPERKSYFGVYSFINNEKK